MRNKIVLLVFVLVFSGCMQSGEPFPAPYMDTTAPSEQTANEPGSNSSPEVPILLVTNYGRYDLLYEDAWSQLRDEPFDYTAADTNSPADRCVFRLSSQGAIGTLRIFDERETLVLKTSGSASIVIPAYHQENGYRAVWISEDEELLADITLSLDAYEQPVSMTNCAYSLAGCKQDIYKYHFSDGSIELKYPVGNNTKLEFVRQVDHDSYLFCAPLSIAGDPYVPSSVWPFLYVVSEQQLYRMGSFPNWASIRWRKEDAVLLPSVEDLSAWMLEQFELLNETCQEQENGELIEYYMSDVLYDAESDFHYAFVIQVQNRAWDAEESTPPYYRKDPIKIFRMRSDAQRTSEHMDTGLFWDKPAYGHRELNMALYEGEVYFISPFYEETGDEPLDLDHAYGIVRYNPQTNTVQYNKINSDDSPQHVVGVSEKYVYVHRGHSEVVDLYERDTGIFHATHDIGVYEMHSIPDTDDMLIVGHNQIYRADPELTCIEVLLDKENLAQNFIAVAEDGFLFYIPDVDQFEHST